MQAKAMDAENQKFQYDKYKGEAKNQKYPPKYPLKRVQKPPVSSGDKQRSELSVDEKPRRPKRPPSGDEDDAESTDKRRKRPPSGDEDDAESTDKKNKKKRKYEDASEDEDKVELRSGRRNKRYTSEDE